MKIFPEKMKQTTKYLLLIIGSLGIAAYGISWQNSSPLILYNSLRIIALIMFVVGIIGLIIEFIKRLKKKKNLSPK